MNILGISALYHDSAACLVQDGKIIAAAQEERFSRKKHDHSFPHQAIKYCLRAGKISSKELDFVAFYDKPFLKLERLLETYLTYAPRGLKSFIKAATLWMKEKLWIKSTIQETLEFDKTILFPEHHLSHAASAFYPSPFPHSAFLTVDGVGEWTTTSYGIGEHNQLHILADIQFPHSLGLLYSAFTYYTGFKVNSGEYKLMGLAPYGEPKYKHLILQELIDLKNDGSFRLNMRYFNYCSGLTMTNHHFHKLFGGPPRKPESKIQQRHMDLARSIQEVIEEAILRMAKHIRKVTKQPYLCLAGGVALNCVANGKLLRTNIFDDIWIQPAAGDAGGALGAALLTWYQYLNNQRHTNLNKKEDSQQGSLLGPEFSPQEIQQFLDEHKIPYTHLNQVEIPETIANLIAQKKVIGWFQGRMEFGPRALGNRSILADARSPQMQSILNLKIKFRESFRPFAPSVLAEEVNHYFELDKPSPYMLLVAPVHPNQLLPLSEKEKNLQGLDKRKAKRSTIPAITHVDNSARIQTVHKNINPLYHQLISTFHKKYNCPVIINTSFNVRGEPIVCTPQDAYKCFMRTHMDYLMLGPFLLEKKHQQPWEEKFDWQKEYELD